MTKHFICPAARKKKKCIQHTPKPTYESHILVSVGSVQVGARGSTAGKFWALQLKKVMAQMFPKCAAEDQTALSLYSNKRARGQQFSTAAQEIEVRN